MNNKELILERIKELGYTLGCYDKTLDSISKNKIKNIINMLDQEYIDEVITIKRKKYVMEVSTVDNEKDIQLLPLDEYINRYGDEILER